LCCDTNMAAMTSCENAPCNCSKSFHMSLPRFWYCRQQDKCFKTEVVRALIVLQTTRFVDAVSGFQDGWKISYQNFRNVCSINCCTFLLVVCSLTCLTGWLIYCCKTRRNVPPVEIFYESNLYFPTPMNPIIQEHLVKDSSTGPGRKTWIHIISTSEIRTPCITVLGTVRLVLEIREFYNRYHSL